MQYFTTFASTKTWLAPRKLRKYRPVCSLPFPYRINQDAHVDLLEPELLNQEIPGAFLVGGFNPFSCTESESLTTPACKTKQKPLWRSIITCTQAYCQRVNSSENLGRSKIVFTHHCVLTTIIIPSGCKSFTSILQKSQIHHVITSSYLRIVP